MATLDLGFDEFGKRHAPDDFLAHFLHARPVRYNENEMIAQTSEAGSVASVPFENPRYQFRNGVHRGTDRNPVIRHDRGKGVKPLKYSFPASS